MKRYLISVVVILSLIMLSIPVLAQDDIKVSIDGQYIEFDVQPRLINGRTMVPLRVIFEALGAEVDWNSDTRTVVAMKNDVTVTATIGSTIMYIDGEKKIMDVAPMLLDGRTLVPARFVAEALECEVEWNQNAKTVYIYSNNSYEDIPDEQN